MYNITSASTSTSVSFKRMRYTGRRKSRRMAKLKTLVPKTLYIMTLILANATIYIGASGVFELEFNKFDISELPPRLSPESYELTNRINESQQTNIETSTNKSPLQVLICLKPAFTSQLDGPCTYGNASTTLIKESHDPTILSQAGSLSTNLVRIPFTFRWTKSFTIIFTGEQMLTGTDGRFGSQQNRHSAEDFNLPDDSTNSGRAVTIYSSSTVQQVASSANKPPSQFIYRHVLTENEILPNLELNPNKPWASRFSHTLNSSLAYRFRIYCSLNYYGDGCTTFCRARDDQFGHYNCSSTGQKICIDGWYGPDCDKARCRLGCNPQHGYCERPDTCTCFDGWTGNKCSECKTHPKCKNGYCLTKNDCLCHKGWGGQLCDQNLNYCGTNEPCKNNGTCQNIPLGGYRCTCPDGFAGANCEYAQNSTQILGTLTQLKAGCTLNPCLNGGTCYGYEGGVPVLIADVVRESSDTNQTQIEEQQGEIERIYRCQCTAGWTGDYCQWPDTDLLALSDVISETEKSFNRPGTSAMITTSSMSDDTEEETKYESLKPATDDKVSPVLSTFIEAPKTEPVHLDMRHLISGVVIASVVGVLLAFLFLAWCCLVAIEQNRFSFIQMNIIRNSGSNGDEATVSSTLRRMHEKIRDSFRLSRNRIKPETKLSIENVLRPPPTYEESSNQTGTHSKNQVEYITINQDAPKVQDLHVKPCINIISDLVKSEEAYQKGLHQPSTSSISEISSTSSLEQPDTVTDAQLNCPRHGHLYRKHTIEKPTNHNLLVRESSLTQHKPPGDSHLTTHLHISSTRHGFMHHTHLGHI